MIRLAEMQDIPAILAIFEQAREFMRTMRNLSQWPASYPNRQLVEEDIRVGHCYVLKRLGKLLEPLRSSSDQIQPTKRLKVLGIFQSLTVQSIVSLQMDK